MMPTSAEEPTALAYGRLPTVQRRCNPICAAAWVQDVLSSDCLKLLAEPTKFAAEQPTQQIARSFLSLGNKPFRLKLSRACSSTWHHVPRFYPTYRRILQCASYS